MELKKIINERRSYRSLEKVDITESVIKELAESARLAPSCFNKQPWRFVFAYAPGILNRLFTEAIKKGNEWVFNASMIIAVCSKKEYDCMLPDGRAYYHFDTGMATAMLLLQATDMGLVAHPIAGFMPAKVKEILAVPADIEVITLVIVGKHSIEIKPELNEVQKNTEQSRPERLPLESIMFLNRLA